MMYSCSIKNGKHKCYSKTEHNVSLVLIKKLKIYLLSNLQFERAVGALERNILHGMAYL